MSHRKYTTKLSSDPLVSPFVFLHRAKFKWLPSFLRKIWIIKEDLRFLITGCAHTLKNIFERKKIIH